MSIAEDLLAITHRVLREDCTALQRDLYRAAHGLREDGTSAKPQTVTELAHKYDNGTGNITRQLAVAEARVYKACCMHLLALLEKQEPEHVTLVEAVTTSTWDESDAKVGYTYHRHDYTERSIHLGAGSEAAIRADKHRRPGAYEQVHQRYADGGRHS